MLVHNAYPVLEYDDNRDAKLNPEILAKEAFKTDKLVITFFPEVIARLKEEGGIIPERIIEGENPFFIYRFADADILITHGQLGCPACAGNLDLLHAMGIKKVMFCGGGGVLDGEIQAGKILVVEGAWILRASLSGSRPGRRQDIHIKYDGIGFIPLGELAKKRNGLTFVMPSLENTMFWLFSK